MSLIACKLRLGREKGSIRLLGLTKGQSKSGSDLQKHQAASAFATTTKQVRSVDLIRHSVAITETLLPVSGYGDQRLQLAAGPPKTEAGDRTVPIPGWLCEDLAEMLARRAAPRGRPIGRDEPLFVNRAGQPLNRDKFRETVIRPALREAGLPEQLRTYDLRHGHASMLIDMGVNPLVVAQRMGHSDPSVTLREYGHLFEGVQERVSEQLDQLRSEAAEGSRQGASITQLDRGFH